MTDIVIDELVTQDGHLIFCIRLNKPFSHPDTLPWVDPPAMLKTGVWTSSFKLDSWVAANDVYVVNDYRTNNR